MRAATARTRASRFWYSSIDDARRRRDLDEGELADPARLELEQALDRGEALEDALRVVEAVDADADAHVRRRPRRSRTRLRHSGTGGCTASASGGHSIEIG